MHIYIHIYIMKMKNMKQWPTHARFWPRYQVSFELIRIEHRWSESFPGEIDDRHLRISRFPTFYLCGSYYVIYGDAITIQSHLPRWDFFRGFPQANRQNFDGPWESKPMGRLGRGQRGMGVGWVHHTWVVVCAVGYTSPNKPADMTNSGSDSTKRVTTISGWWYTYPSEKYESQLGWWHSQYMGK